MIDAPYHCPHCKKQWDSLFEDVTRCCYCGEKLVEGFPQLEPLVNETFPTNMGETIHPYNKPTKREEILREAIQCVTKDRNATHGNPEDNFKIIVGYWNQYLETRVKRNDYTNFLDEVDVAVMMLLMKVSRLAKSPGHMDHWVDIAGYAACGGGIAVKG